MGRKFNFFILWIQIVNIASQSTENLCDFQLCNENNSVVGVNVNCQRYVHFVTDQAQKSLNNVEGVDDVATLRICFVACKKAFFAVILILLMSPTHSDAKALLGIGNNGSKSQTTTRDIRKETISQTKGQWDTRFVASSGVQAGMGSCLSPFG